ncbi:SAV_915 family protein [Streptomyces sp. M19]
MSLNRDAEDSEPCLAHPAGLLFVPVRPGPAGWAAHVFRTPLGDRTAVGFTTKGRLVWTLGHDQPWIVLAEPAVRALMEPLGITRLTVDPQFAAPAAVSPPQQPLPRSPRGGPPRPRTPRSAA